LEISLPYATERTAHLLHQLHLKAGVNRATHWKQHFVLADQRIDSGERHSSVRRGSEQGDWEARKEVFSPIQAITGIIADGCTICDCTIYISCGGAGSAAPKTGIGSGNRGQCCVDVEVSCIPHVVGVISQQVMHANVSQEIGSEHHTPTNLLLNA